MNKDNRISNLPENLKLYSNVIEPFPSKPAAPTDPNQNDDDVLFLITKSGSHNEKITYSNLKSSILDNTVFLTGDQLISGEKTFADTCTFEDTVYVHEVIDITETGDISGNVFVGESGLFEKVGVGLHFTDRRVLKEVYSDFPDNESGYLEYDFGGGIDPQTYSGGLDFINGAPDFSTSVSSYPLYEPSGWYNSNIPVSQQNHQEDLSLDGHSLDPDYIHREMRGAWVGVSFEEPFNYKSFSIFHSGLDHCAENLKVVASNNDKDWKIIHHISGLETGDYNTNNKASIFALDDFYPEKYSHYRLVAEKVISGNFWELNHFNFSGVELHLRRKSVDPQYTLHVSGDSCFIGDIAHTGFGRQSGNLYRIGDTTQTGDSYIDGNESVTGDIYVGETIYHLNDEDTFIRFKEDDVKIQAGTGAKLTLSESGNNKIQFYTSGIEQMRIDESGFVGINTTTPFAELCVTGDSYLECVFTTGEDGRWERVFGGSDEDVSFVTELSKGQDSYQIDFPKTFGIDPSVTLTLENNMGGPIIPYCISGVNNFQYHINFASNLSNDGYKIHTLARPTGHLSLNKTITQSFIEEISPEPGKDIYEIFYPQPFHTNPVVAATLEHENVILPFVISGIEASSFKLVFGRELHDTCKIHIHAVR